MKYEAIDNWNSEYLEHSIGRSSGGGRHKYFYKLGTGPNARYFYSAQEYAAYQRNLRNGSRSGNDTRNIRTTTNNNQRSYNKSQDRLRQTQIRKEQQSASNRTDRELASKRRENRKQAYVDFQKNRGKTPTSNAKIKNDQSLIREDKLDQKRAIERNRQRMVAARKKADAVREDKQSKKDVLTRLKNAVDEPTKLKRKARVTAYKAKFALGDAKRKAKKTYNNAKSNAQRVYNTAKPKVQKAYNTVSRKANKVYNSSQAKSTRKKARSTAKKAYNSGRKFVKNLFKKRK